LIPLEEKGTSLAGFSGKQTICRPSRGDVQWPRA
jgi:hypothetical protein